MRMVPDLSVIGDPNTGFVEYFTGSSSGVCHRSCSGGWDTIGGTSISSQLVGALLAVSAQSCGVSRLGFVNPALYAMASQGVGFTDVTTGTNDLYGEGVYSAGPGYDMASGLGSPDASFISGICPPKIDATKGSLVASSSSPASRRGADDADLDAGRRERHSARRHVGHRERHRGERHDRDRRRLGEHGLERRRQRRGHDERLGHRRHHRKPRPCVGPLSGEGQLPVPSDLQCDAQLRRAVHAEVRGDEPRCAIDRETDRARRRLHARGEAHHRATAGAPSSAYQYSINNGASWTSFSRVTKSASTTRLAKGRRYSVSVRARNAHGAGAKISAVDGNDAQIKILKRRVVPHRLDPSSRCSRTPRLDGGGGPKSCGSNTQLKDTCEVPTNTISG
jgi:hypothetical protein